MKLLGKKLLDDFKRQHADARSQIESWEAEVKEAEWNTPHDLKRGYPRVSLIGNQDVIFDICNNKYRLWALVNYKNGVVLVKKTGSHKEYGKWKIK